MQLSKVLIYAIAAVGVTARFERDIDLERRGAALERAYLRARAALYEDTNVPRKRAAKAPAKARTKAPAKARAKAPAKAPLKTAHRRPKMGIPVSEQQIN